MIQEKTHFLHLKSNLQAIPVCLAALVLWAIIGGWYVTVAPKNMAGPDNIGIVFSTLGLCLFLADRLALLWLKVYSRVLFFATWLWGLAFIIWGLFAWLQSFSKRYVYFFIIHWSILLVIIALISLWTSRRRRTTA